MLTNCGDISTGVKGYVKCDISISSKGDTMQPGQKASDAEEQIDKYELTHLHNLTDQMFLWISEKET